jgi:ATP-dependent helicase/DNAse subunit B
MILTHNEINVQLTYTLEEHEAFTRTIESFIREINATLRKKTPWYLTRELRDEFIETLDDLERTMMIARSNAGIQLTLDIQEFLKFTENLQALRFFLNDFQEWYDHRDEYEKAETFENSQDLIDRLIALLGINVNVVN